MDEQQNIVTKDDYYPFGLQMPGLTYNNGNPNDRLKYSGKELDQEGGLYKYHFGWRDYNPELGRWFVVDPARQFASPYVMVGNNPINFYDPYGLWSIGLGFVFGYDDRGWHAGYGAAFDFDLEVVDIGLNASHVWHNDGSNSVNFSAGGGFNFGVVGAEANIGYTNNSVSGESFNAYAGANIVAVGAGIGYNQDAYGGSFFAEGYLGLKGLTSIGGGYQNGWGSHYSGWFGQATLLSNSWGNYGNGWNYGGFQHNTILASYTSANERDNATLHTDHSDIIGHSAIVGNYAGEDFEISVGPGSRSVGFSPKGILSFLFPQSGSAEYTTYAGSGGTELNGLNMRKLSQYSKFIGALGKAGILPYQALTACSFYTALGITYAGGFVVPGASLHPFIIEKQMQLNSLTNR